MAIPSARKWRKGEKMRAEDLLRIMNTDFYTGVPDSLPYPGEASPSPYPETHADVRHRFPVPPANQSQKVQESHTPADAVAMLPD